jgi:hypothetical protein
MQAEDTVDGEAVAHEQFRQLGCGELLGVERVHRLVEPG